MATSRSAASAPGQEGDTMIRRAEGRLGRPPLPPGVKNERFSCYVSEAVREGLDELASERSTTRTNLVRAILTDYVAARRPLPAGVCANGDGQPHVDGPGAVAPPVGRALRSSAGGRP
jgi:hypothetical protein